MPMVIENALQMIVPAPDSQFLLNNCKCGSDQVVYLQLLVDGEALWVVRCMDCGLQTSPHAVRHDAQLEWNKEKCHETS